MINSITKEGIRKMTLLLGKSKSYGDIDLDSLKKLYFYSIKRYKGLYWGLVAVYEMGRIDGIRLERARRKCNSEKHEFIEKNIYIN